MMKKILLFICILCLGLFPVFSSSSATTTTVETAAIEQVVYITKTGTKYHKSSCRYLSKSKIKTTKTQAQKSGYSACKVCKP